MSQVLRQDATLLPGPGQMLHNAFYRVDHSGSSCTQGGGGHVPECNVLGVFVADQTHGLSACGVYSMGLREANVLSIQRSGLPNVTAITRTKSGITSRCWVGPNAFMTLYSGGS